MADYKVRQLRFENAGTWVSFSLIPDKNFFNPKPLTHCAILYQLDDGSPMHLHCCTGWMEENGEWTLDMNKADIEADKTFIAWTYTPKGVSRVR